MSATLYQPLRSGDRGCGTGGGESFGSHTKSWTVSVMGVHGPPGSGAYSTLYWNGLAMLNAPSMLVRPPKGWSPTPLGLSTCGVFVTYLSCPDPYPWLSIWEVGIKPTAVISGGGGH